MGWNRLYKCGKCKNLISYESLLAWVNDYCPVCRQYARLTFKQTVSEDEIEKYPKFNINVEFEESARRQREQAENV